MKIARFSKNKTENWGIVEGDKLRLLKSPPYKKIALSSKKILLKKCKLLAPANPSKIVLVGLNYRDHARELGMKVPREPIIFLKPPTAVIGSNQAIIYPKTVRRLDYEAELAVVIKKTAKNISQKNAQDYLLGFTCLNDVTARNLQSKDKQWTRAKSFDTFCPLGPWLETKLDSSNLKIQSYLNQKLKQNSTTANFIFSVPKLICFISKVMTLYPGDIISTGTPPGVGRMRSGDQIEVAIEGIGRLKNYVS